MSNQNEIKVSVIKNIVGATIIPTIGVSDENKVRIVVSNASVGNTFVIRARIKGQDDWDNLSTIVGDSKSLVKVSTYDELQIECTTYGTTGYYVKVVVSSFNDAGAATSIGAPAGDLIVEPDQVNFTSSDGSVIITTDNSTQTIDIKAIGGGGGSATKYIKTVNLVDWTGPSSGEYTLTIPYSTHTIANPSVFCYESAGLSFDQILVFTEMNSSFDVIIKVNQTPDSRFIGKIVIE